MKTLISFIEGIGSAITGFFSFVFSLIEDIVYLVKLTGRMLAQIPVFFSWLPGPVLAVIVTAVTVAVLYKVLGRE